jgi:hypothetical protein
MHVNSFFFRLLALIEQYRAVWLSRYLPAGMQAGFRVRLTIFYKDFRFFPCFLFLVSDADFYDFRRPCFI